VPEQLRPVPTVHASAPGVVEARLAFGVGSCDEPVTLAGITHLVEHLAVRGALPITTWHNATTHDHVTFFEVTTETTDEALALLGRFAASVSALAETTDDTVVRERRVLEKEDRLRFHEQVASVHTARFGPAGPGRSGAGSAAVAGITAEEVRNWVAERFVAENAVVIVRGGTAPPEVIDLPLPAGRPGRPSTRIERWTGPMRRGALVESALGGTAASVVVPAEVAPLADAVIEHEVFDALRIEAALAYDVSSHTLDLDADTSVVAVTADGDDSDVEETTAAVVGVFRRLAEHGPSAATIARIDASRALNALYPSSGPDVTIWATMLRRLRGIGLAPSADSPVSPAELAQLREALEDAFPTLLVCVDRDADVDFAALARRHGLEHDDAKIGRPVPPRVWFPARPGRGRSTHRDRLLSGLATMHAEIVDHRLVLRPRGEESREVDLAQAAVVGRRGSEGVTIVDTQGDSFHIRAAEWWRGRRFVAAVLAATPDHLVRDFSS